MARISNAMGSEAQETFGTWKVYGKDANFINLLISAVKVIGNYDKLYY